MGPSALEITMKLKDRLAASPEADRGELVRRPPPRCGAP